MSFLKGAHRWTFYYGFQQALDTGNFWHIITTCPVIIKSDQYTRATAKLR